MESMAPKRNVSEQKYCRMCKRVLPPSYNKEYCPACEDLRLFDQVREFVRSNEVNEYQVADHFDIPVRVVKQWIKEGRIEYKERDKKNIMSTFCSRCGAPVTFGSLCPQCLRLMNGEKTKGYAKVEKHEDDNKMRFLDSQEIGE